MRSPARASRRCWRRGSTAFPTSRAPTCPSRRGPMTSASAVDLLDRSLRDQAGAIAGGEADPGELLDAALARIEERNPAVNAMVEVFPEESRRMLAEAPRGPLYGVPVAIKDEWPLPWRAQRLGAAEYVRRRSPASPGPTARFGMPGRSSSAWRTCTSTARGAPATSPPSGRLGNPGV